MRSMSKRLIVAVLSLALAGSGLPLVASADMIGTQAAIDLQRGSQAIENVEAALSRSDVRDQLRRLGVDPAQVNTRLASLTDQEVAMLDEKLSELPAGGDALAVIGIVFLVLLILELVGITDVFKRI